MCAYIAPGCATAILKWFAMGKEVDDIIPVASSASNTVDHSSSHQGLMLVFCTSGLLICHMMWGIFQERIMASEYVENNKKEHFRNSQFLVFMNRFFSVVAAAVILLFSKQSNVDAPFYMYSYASLSNILSSWCQYESLKYIIFPLLTLGKSCKVIPVMIMGKFISKKSYETYEYVTAVFISIGIFMFFISTKEDKKVYQETLLVSGLILLIGYLLFDSFTSNWQDKIFKDYKVSPVKMMFGVNLCSVVLTSVSLIEQGGFSDAIAFTVRHRAFLNHVFSLSVCSAVGQLFIFKTIKEFGPVIFTIIMTTRQALAVLFSCVYFSHPVGVAGFTGIAIAFAAIFSQIFFKQRSKMQHSGK